MTGPNLAVGKKKKKKRSAEQNALKEIKKYQRSTELLIRFKPFVRLCRGIANEVALGAQWACQPPRFSIDAMKALQEASEEFLVRVLSHSNLNAHHAKRITLMKQDIKLAVFIGNENLSIVQ